MRLPLPLTLLLLAGCATEADGPLFQKGTVEEQDLALNLATDEMASRELDLGVAVQDLRLDRVEIDELNMAHTRFQQTFQGVPVFGGEAIVHLDPDGAVRDITNALLPRVMVNTVPEYAPEEAVDYAVEAAGGWEKVSDAPDGSLWIFRKDGTDHLAWRVEIPMIDGSTEPAKPVVFVDAHTGDVLFQYDNLQHGAASGTGTAYYSGNVSFNTYLSGTSYYLEDSTRKLGTYSYKNTTTSLYYNTDTDNAWTNSTQYVAVQAHYSSVKVWDFYSNVLGRNGIDGAGGPAYVSSLTGVGGVITSAVSYSTNYSNAFWDGQAMTYGDGDGVSFLPLVTVDIAGHEMTHGVTDYTAKLVYTGESGGLNEAMSDIFGAMVERYADGSVTSSDTWKIGEDAYTPGTAGDALRYMNNPALDGGSLDYYTSNAGNYDVHYSSGIANLAFYLLSEGGAHPTRGGSAMTGVGADKATKIFYRALSTYMTSATNFTGARTATLSAATDLYGSASTEYAAVQNAWAMVGVGAAAGGGGSTCVGYTYSNAGSLSGTGAYAYEPAGTYYTSSKSGTHSASLPIPAGANFDLYLQKYDSRKKVWTNVATSTKAGTTTETISYNGSSGYYTYKVVSTSGSGSYTLCSNRP